MNLNKCSAGIVLYTSSFCSSSCVVSINKSCKTHLTMICLKMRRWSLYVSVGGRGGRVDVAGGNGAGATNFWNGAKEVSALSRLFSDYLVFGVIMSWACSGQGVSTKWTRRGRVQENRTHHQPHRPCYQVRPPHVIADQTIAMPL